MRFIENNYDLSKNDHMAKKLNSEIFGKEIKVKEVTSFENKSKLPWVMNKLKNPVKIGEPLVFEDGLQTENVKNVDLISGAYVVQTINSVFELKISK